MVSQLHTGKGPSRRLVDASAQGDTAHQPFVSSYYRGRVVVAPRLKRALGPGGRSGRCRRRHHSSSSADRRFLGRCSHAMPRLQSEVTRHRPRRVLFPLHEDCVFPLAQSLCLCVSPRRTTHLESRTRDLVCSLFNGRIFDSLTRRRIHGRGWDSPVQSR